MILRTVTSAECNGKAGSRVLTHVNALNSMSNPLVAIAHAYCAAEDDFSNSFMCVFCTEVRQYCDLHNAFLVVAPYNPVWRISHSKLSSVVCSLQY